MQVAIRQRLTQQERALQAEIAQGGAGGTDAAERLELLRRSGLLAPREERSMATLTRSVKSPLTHADLDEHPRRAAADHDLNRPAIERLRTSWPPLEPALRRQLLTG